MKKTIRVLSAAATLCVCLAVCAFISNPPAGSKLYKKMKPAVEHPWSNLLDKKLSQWGMYLAFSHKATYNGQKPVDEKGVEIQPIGYDKNEKNVFTVVEQQGVPVLRISGEYYGCVFTKQAYGNYHLKLKVKWGTLMFGPRVGKLKDSGILYNSNGEAGADYWRAWMRSQEFQIMEGHMGDYWNIANSAIDIRAYLSEGKMNNVADPGQPFLNFGAGTPNGLCLKSANYESPMSQWTTVDLISFEGKSLHIINGHVVMVLKNSRSVEDGKSTPMTKGKIQLQSEGSEVYYKDIQIQKIDAMPEQYKHYFN